MRIRATEEAERTVERVAASGRDALVIVLGTGCCDSTAPYLYDHYFPGADARRVGEIAGVPVVAHEWLARLYPDDESLEIDVDGGVVSDSFSLESEYGCRFTLRAAAARPDRR